MLENELTMQQTIDQSEYWEFDPDLNFEKNEPVTMPKNLVRFLWNISGYCTDPNDKGLYNNRKAMFEALDIIYKALDKAMLCTQSHVPVPMKEKEKQ